MELRQNRQLALLKRSAKNKYRLPHKFRQRTRILNLVLFISFDSGLDTHILHICVVCMILHFFVDAWVKFYFLFNFYFSNLSLIYLRDVPYIFPWSWSSLISICDSSGFFCPSRSSLNPSNPSTANVINNNIIVQLLLLLLLLLLIVPLLQY